jgi:endogenous inhibitor of DNA gyrase (YacG/DUF329 family)
VYECPICKRPVPATPEARHRPFCSERCRTVDLGGWLTGAYRISRPVEEEDLDEGLSTRVLDSDGERRH